MISAANAVGQDESHLCDAPAADALGARVHRTVVEPFLGLREAAALVGFNVSINSGFRGFERQLSIWNRKASGELPVLDSDAQPIDISRLSDHDLTFAILRWSALPGASRHHWGTDLDIFDAAAQPPGYEIQLVPSEYEGDGLFAPFSAWLDDRIARRMSFGFFRPYDRDRHGVAPERWHLSYAPVANEFVSTLSADVLRTAIAAADMRLKETVLANLDEIMTRFVRNTNPGEI